MKITYKIFSIACLLLFLSHTVNAQNERNQGIIYSYLHGWEYSIKAGFSIGGTAPLPLPEEIRSIDSYAPSIAISIEGNATKWFDEQKKWGMTVGERLEQKYDHRSYRKNLRYEDIQYERWRTERFMDWRCKDESQKLLPYYPGIG